MSYRMSRRAYADTYGATVGDRVRLADTELFIEVERDKPPSGMRAKFGGATTPPTVMRTNLAAVK